MYKNDKFDHPLSFLKQSFMLLFAKLETKKRSRNSKSISKMKKFGIAWSRNCGDGLKDLSSKLWPTLVLPAELSKEYMPSRKPSMLEFKQQRRKATKSRSSSLVPQNTHVRCLQSPFKLASKFSTLL